MTVLVDDAIWPWRGRRWAHLVSDRDADELHDLAHGIGMPFLAFQGDHYDVHEDLRRLAIERGAVATPARQLVRALRAAGLRHKGSVEPWEWGRELPASRHAIDDALGRIGLDRLEGRDGCGDALAELGPSARLRTARRSGLWIAVATIDRPREPDGGIDRMSSRLAVHRAAGERGAFVEVALADR